MAAKPTPGNLLDRVAGLRDRATEARKRMEADRWLEENGRGTYGTRATGRSMADRRTRPIRTEYYARVVSVGHCLGCDVGKLVFTRNHRGGTYYSCSAGGHQCYYIGIDGSNGSGYELVVAAVSRKAGSQ
jgi:hypothetical protein